jgi:membrane associated rhomboid family serine protease
MNDSIITYLLIGITALVSFGAFQNVDLMNKCIFYPADIKSKREFWRFITHGFIHADMQHLLFNMITLFFFGRFVEKPFNEIFGNAFIYPLFYILALIASSLPSYKKHQDDYYYRSLGASGAVSAVLYAAIVFNPWMRINFIPGIVYAIGYLVYSNYMSRKQVDNIGHDAHMYGAIFGFIFPFVFKPDLIPYFLEQLKNPHF